MSDIKPMARLRMLAKGLFQRGHEGYAANLNGLLDELDAESGWTRTVDELPMDGDYVIVFSKGGSVQEQTWYQVPDCFGKRYWYCYEELVDRVNIEEITHWMPLPQPPKD